jgi:predicted nucleotidyltransferase
MRFKLKGVEGEISNSDIRNIIDTFVELLTIDEMIVSVEVFGGLVRNPDNVHGDIDLLITLEELPKESTERVLRKVADEWKSLVDKRPEMALIDCFFTDGEVVVSFQYNLDFLQVFQVTTTPKEGGLDDDDTHIYIGEKRKVSDIFP